MELKIFKKEQNYYDEYETFCYQNCVRQILEYMEVSNSFAYINASLSFIIEYDENDNYRICFDDDAYGIVPSMSDAILRKDDFRETNLVWEDNKKLIEKGNPLIITTDSYYLSHLPYYKKSHGRHCLLWVGYNDATDNPIVIDWAAPWYFKGEVSKTDFLQARLSRNDQDEGVFSGLAIANNWSYIDHQKWKEQDVREITMEIISLSYHQYKKEKSQNRYYGIDALEQVRDILDRMIFLSTEDRKQKMRHLYNQLYWSVKRKRFFCFYIQMAIEKEILCEEFKSVELSCKNLYTLWESYLAFLLKHSFVAREKSIQKLVDNLEEIINEEKKLIAIIGGFL